MKAILVIDMPDYLKDYLDKIKVFYAVGTLNGQELFHRSNQPLKPMPQKKEETFAYWIARGCNDPESYINGWNACLDEILGEEE